MPDDLKGAAWWAEWAEWAKHKRPHLETAQLALFADELIGILAHGGTIASDWPKGSGLLLLRRLAKFVKKHQDPLAPLRSRMRSMRQTWGE